MTGQWAWRVCVCLLMVGSTGCYYDQWQNAERDNRVLREDLARAKDELQGCQLQNQQKDTTIDALNKQLAAKDQQVASLTAENEGLRKAFGSAQTTLENMANKKIGDVTIVSQMLPKELDDALKKFAADNKDLFEYLPEKGALRWKADMLFPLGSDELASNDPKIAEAMKKFAEIVNSAAATGFDVIVVGHTCTTPIKKAETKARFPTNWHLSAGRAIKIMEALAGNGVAMTRMGVMGYGEYRPIADNTTNDGKAKNRRVEIYLVKKGSVQSMGMNIMHAPEQDLVYMPATAGQQGS